jgi:hypothetical protein
VLGPGEAVTGSVTIRNIGWTAGDFRLSLGHVVDTPGPNGGRFSNLLQLAVDDVTNPASPLAIYRGLLASLPRTAVGNFPRGGWRRYRFTVSWPDGGAADIAFVASMLRVEFVWTAAQGFTWQPPHTSPPPSSPPRDRLLPPHLTLRVPKRQRVLKHHGLLVRAGCDQACTLELGARLSSVRQALAPGVTSTVKLTLPKTVLRRLRAALARHRKPVVRIKVAARGAGGETGPLKRKVRVVG